MQRRDQLFQLTGLPLLVVVGCGRERLGDGRDRDVVRAADRVDPLDVRGRVLAVVDPDLDQSVLRLAVDRLLVLRADLGALGNRVGEAVRRDQLQADRRAERPEDALAVADRHASEAAADLGPELVVLGERDRLEVALLLREVRLVGRVEPLVVGDDGGNHLTHAPRGVPLVGVVALLQPEQIADRERRPARDRIRGKEPRGPGVVVDPVHDRELRARHRARVARGRLIVVGIGVRVDDDALHRHLGAAELRRDAPPEVLGSDDLQLLAGRAVVRPARPGRPVRSARPAGGKRGGRGQDDDRQDRPLAHSGTLTLVWQHRRAAL
jgi:hypothetical protein